MTFFRITGPDQIDVVSHVFAGEILREGYGIPGPETNLVLSIAYMSDAYAITTDEGEDVLVELIRG